MKLINQITIGLSLLALTACKNPVLISGGDSEIAKPGEYSWQTNLNAHFNKIDGFMGRGQVEAGTGTSALVAEPQPVPSTNCPVTMTLAESGVTAPPNCPQPPPPCREELVSSSGSHCPPPPYQILDFGIFGTGSLSLSQDSRASFLPTRLSVEFDSHRYPECQAAALAASSTQTQFDIVGDGILIRNVNTGDSLVRFTKITSCEAGEPQPAQTVEVTLATVESAHLAIPPRPLTPSMPCYLDPVTNEVRCPTYDETPALAVIQGLEATTQASAPAVRTTLTWAAKGDIAQKCYDKAVEAKASNKGLRVRGLSRLEPIGLHDEAVGLAANSSDLSPLPQRYVSFTEILECDVATVVQPH